jgi:hypothetical protein
MNGIVLTTTPIICEGNETIYLLQDLQTFVLMLIITFGMMYFVSTKILPSAVFGDEPKESSTVGFLRSIVGYYVLVVLVIELVSLITDTDYGCLLPQIPPEFNVLFNIITLL